MKRPSLNHPHLGGHTMILDEDRLRAECPRHSGVLPGSQTFPAAFDVRLCSGWLGLSLTLALVSCARGPGPVVPQTPVERQMIGLLEKFDRYDDNGDGELQLSELKQAEELTGRPAARILAFYDTDRSGGISLREAQAGYARAAEAEALAKDRLNKQQ
ncbi:MAG: EF-hand domain-containing protein [Akkermansiaceae bacterium]